MDASAQDRLERDGFAVLTIDDRSLEALDDLYRRTRPERLDEFTATIQLTDADHRRAVHHGVRDAVGALIAASFVDHRVVAGNFVVKQPGPWVVEPHQDFNFLDEDQSAAVLGWIPLHDVEPANGCLHVVPGSHLLPTVPRGSGDHRFPFAPVLDHLKVARSVAVPLRRGELIVYDARALHWSTGNTSDTERVAGAFAAIPSDVELLHYHVEADDTVTVLVVDDDIYADTPFHAYPVRGRVIAREPLPAVASYDVTGVDRALAAAVGSAR